jgi:hypothetical protein
MSANTVIYTTLIGTEEITDEETAVGYTETDGGKMVIYALDSDTAHRLEYLLRTHPDTDGGWIADAVLINAAANHIDLD